MPEMGGPLEFIGNGNLEWQSRPISSATQNVKQTYNFLIQEQAKFHVKIRVKLVVSLQTLRHDVNAVLTLVRDVGKHAREEADENVLND
jgi:hypothetical protein